MKLQISVEEAKKIIDEIVDDQFVIEALDEAGLAPRQIEIKVETKGHYISTNNVPMNLAKEIDFEAKSANKIDCDQYLSLDKINLEKEGAIDTIPSAA